MTAPTEFPLAKKILFVREFGIRPRSSGGTLILGGRHIRVEMCHHNDRDIGNNRTIE